jgi:hypothetical protein
MMSAITSYSPGFKLRSALTACAVEVKREQEVWSYLEAHPDLLSLTEDICRATRKEFGPAAVLSLQLNRDPEIVDEYIVLHVRLAQYGADTLARVRSVSDAFDSELCNASGSILVTTDFCPLR